MDIPTNFTIGSTESIRESKQKTNAELSSEDFLKIVAASISNPPISSGEGGGSSDGGSGDYISQIVQFNMVDQLTALTETVTTNMLMMQQQQGLDMLGKEVKVLDETTFVTGTVEKVRYTEGYATLQINGKEYALNDVVEVGVEANEPKN